jgi:predicted nucleic acid-binding protein
MEIVIDTSAVIAVILNEASKPILITQTVGAELFAPTSLHWEIANAFSAMLKRKRITLEQAQQAIDAYQQIPLRFIDVDLSHALALSAQLDIYAYDAYILACAIQQQCPMLTLDSGLVHAAQRIGIKVLEVK